jgi:photosystem II stability/assembly factor-like uncharacterized protein
MRKQLLVFSLAGACAIATATILYFTVDKNHLQSNAELPLASRDKHEMKQEELKERAEHEWLMTHDPDLGYIPSERLIEARLKLRDMSEKSNTRILAGVGWAERGPNNIGGRSRSALIDLSDATGNTVIVGSVSGGLWRTTNFKAGSPSYTQVASVSANLAVTCLAQDPSNLSVMYAGTGEGFGNADAVRGLGIYKSLDGGATWNLLPATTVGGANVNDFHFVQKIVVYNNGHVYASGISAAFCNSGGVLKSTDGGATWTRVIGLYTGGGVCSNAFDFLGYDIEISAAGDLYASVRDVSVADTTRGKIFKSPAGVNVGDVGTWTDISPAPRAGRFWQRIELACAPSNNNRVYALMQGIANSIDTIVRSDDGGTTWNFIDNVVVWCDQGDSVTADFSRNQAWYDLALAVKPDDDQTVFAGGVDIMSTSNSGTTWAQLTQWNSGCLDASNDPLPFVHADIHNIIYFPGSTTEFIVVCDGGIFHTTDNGSTFTAKNLGFNVTQYYSCAINGASGSDYMLGGTQDNGSHKFTAGGINTVTTVTGGDGGFCYIDQLDPTFQITSFTGSQYVISRNGGASFSVGAFFAGGRFINAGDYDDVQKLLYVGGANQNLRRINNISAGTISANSFAVAPSTSFAVSAVKVDPNTPNRLLVAFSTASGAASQIPVLFIVDNANAAPDTTQLPLPGGATGITSGAYISSLDIENGDANHYLLTVSNYGRPSIFESTDGGLNWTSLDNNGVNLPDMPVRWGAFVPGGFNPGQRTTATGGILIATELGVWSASTITGNTTVWTANNTGMGNVRVDMLEVRNSDKVVVAATHGRGLFTGMLLSGNLPVTFIAFNGRAEARHNDLVWDVDNEHNNKGFELERRYAEENDFVKVGFVTGKNTPGKNRYQYKDQAIDFGKSRVYYRLKQLDLDNKHSYSEVITLQRQASSKLVEYMSVAGGNLIIRINNGNSNASMRVKIFDMGGKLLRNDQVPFQSRQTDISQMAAGTYLVEVTAPDNRRHSQKIVK